MQESSRQVPGASAAELPGATGVAAVQRTRRAWGLLAMVALVVLAAIGIHSVLTANDESTDDAQVQADVVPIAARVAGQVAKVYVIDDQPVKKGDPLVELDATDYSARVMQAEGELEAAKAQASASDAQAQVIQASVTGGLSSAQALVSGSSVQVASADAQIAAARAGLLRAQAEADKASLDLGRDEKLLRVGAIPREKLENARLAETGAKAVLEQARAQLNAAMEAKRVARSRVAEATGRLSQSSPIDQQIAAAEANAQLAHARVKSAEAALELAKLQLSYTRVVAPEAGMVSRLSAHVGALVQPGQPLAQLVPHASYVVANMKETQIGEMRVGDRAEIKIDAYPGQRFEGRVESLSWGTGAQFSLLPPDNASGNFVKVVQRVPVRIGWLRVPEVPLRAGLSAEVTVYVGTPANQDSAGTTAGTVSARNMLSR